MNSPQTNASAPSSPQTGENEPTDICVVCLEPVGLSSTAVVPCRHPFHYECISKWVTNSSTCPHCRSEITALETSSGWMTSSPPGGVANTGTTGTTTKTWTSWTVTWEPANSPNERQRQLRRANSSHEPHFEVDVLDE